MRRALVGLVAVGFLATACGGGTAGSPTAAKDRSTQPSTTSRGPFDGRVLADGEVAKADKLDGVRLESPDDGALRNYGIAMDVLDFGSADVVDAGGGIEYGSKDDSTLLAFRLRVTAFAEELSDKVTATVSVDGKQRTLPDFEYSMSTSNEDETIQYVVAVPKDRREVELALKYADLAQTFDLLEGKRTGAQPEILYRAEDGPTVFVENLTPAKLTANDDEGKPGNYIVAVTNATLTYFTPELGDQPADDEKAWLVVTYEPGGDGSITYNTTPLGCVIPFAAISLTDEAGATYAVVDKHSSMEEFDSTHVLAFEVPADLRKATLTVAPPSFSCANGGLDYPFTTTANATVELAFPEK